LPEIQSSLKSLKTKSTIRNEIASVVEQELRNESPQISQAISTDVYAQWIEFQREFKEVLSLAKEIPKFKEILKTYGLPKVSSLIGVALSNVDRSQIEEAIQSGKFERVLSLPPRSWDILTTSHDFSKIIDWANLAGNKIDDVVEFELYKYINPDELDRRTLNDILVIRDHSTISNLAMLDIQSIRSLLKIFSHNLTKITDDLSQKDLTQLADYIVQFGAERVNQVVQFLLVNDPTKIRNNRVIHDIISSNDINESIKFWREPLFLTSVPIGILGVIRGTISWQLFTDKYEHAAIVIFLLIGVAILLGITVGFRLLPIFKSATSSALSLITQQFVKQAEPNEKQAEPDVKKKGVTGVLDFIMLISLDSLHNQEIEVGQLLSVTVVEAANYLKDLREDWRNLFGGRMTHYENLIQHAIDEALEKLEEKAKKHNYDGIIGLKISHPKITAGAVEIIVYGNGYKNKIRSALQSISTSEEELGTSKK